MRKTMISAVLLMALLLIASAAFAKEDNLISFEVSPNPMDKECTISLVFQTPGSVAMNLQIETPEGVVVRNIYSGLCNKTMLFSWDRLSNNGVYMPAGRYFVSLTYDTRYTSTKKTVILK
jgi:hypothetical protein